MNSVDTRPHHRHRARTRRAGAIDQHVAAARHCSLCQLVTPTFDMTISPEDVQSLLDREKIRDCIARVARAEDRRDQALLRGCFARNASVDFGIFRGSLEEYLDWVVPGAPAVLLTQHILAQTLIELSGNTYLTETHVTSYHRVDMGHEQRDLIIGGRYLDAWARQGSDWLIEKRTMLYDWCQQLGPSADWSHGLLGTPFSAPHFVGRTQADFSVEFLADKRSER